MRLPSLRLPERIGWRDHASGAGLGRAYLVWLLATARAVGFPRDEGVYFHAAGEYVRWWRMLFERGSDALQQGAIDSAFSANHEHPSLMKSLFSLSWMAFHEKWKVFKDASNGLVRVVGDGANHWPLVYDRDLADLYARLAAHEDAAGALSLLLLVVSLVVLVGLRDRWLVRA